MYTGVELWHVSWLLQNYSVNAYDCDLISNITGLESNDSQHCTGSGLRDRSFVQYERHYVCDG